jgi:hypothetical protein
MEIDLSGKRPFGKSTGSGVVLQQALSPPEKGRPDQQSHWFQRAQLPCLICVNL